MGVVPPFCTINYEKTVFDASSGLRNHSYKLREGSSVATKT